MQRSAYYTHIDTLVANRSRNQRSLLPNHSCQELAFFQEVPNTMNNDSTPKGQPPFRVDSQPRLAVWSALSQHLAQQFPPDKHARLRIVVGVSGGADSVALLRLLAELWQSHPRTDHRHLIAAHYNHGLRGEHSAEDQRFVAALAKSLAVEFATETDPDAPVQPSSGRGESPPPPSPASTGDAESPPGSEAAMRQRRYRFLHRIVAARGARCLLTAHTADDQIETVLHHLFRGTGPAGLCGIPETRSLGQDFVIRRPLLGLGRAQLRAGLIEIGQTWREDASNDHHDYQRNWIRGELLPQIRGRYPAADGAILRLIETQNQWYQNLQRQAMQWLEDCVVFADQQVQLPRGPVDPAVLALVLTSIWDRCGWPRQALATKHHQAVAALVTGAQRTAVTLPGAIRAAVAGKGTVVISRRTAKPPSRSPEAR